MDCINGQDCEFEKFDEFSQVDEALLMSLLDDSQVLEEESCDKEKLSSVMRSLEAEIDQHVDQYPMNNDISPNKYWGNDHDLIMEGFDDTQGSDPVHMLEAELGCNWMDLEMIGDDYLYNDHDHAATTTLDHYFDQYNFNGVSFEDYDQLVQHGGFWQEP